MRSNRRHAFTLVELLIVLAIISLLLAILLPALSSARAASQAGVCLANLRRLGIANQLYVQAFDVFPPFRLSNEPAIGPAYVNAYGAEKPRWQWFLDQGIGPVTEPDGFTTPFGDNSVSSTTGRNGMTMTNRYFTDPALNDERFTFNIRNGAYGYNYQYLGNTRTDAVPGEYDRWPLSVTSITTPSQTVLLADSRGGELGHGNHSYTLDPPRLAVSANARKFGPNGSSPGESLGHSPVEMRHLGKGNVAFVDTHAEPMRLPELGYSLDGSRHPVQDGPGASNALWSGAGRDEP